MPTGRSSLEQRRPAPRVRPRGAALAAATLGLAALAYALPRPDNRDAPADRAGGPPPGTPPAARQLDDPAEILEGKPAFVVPARTPVLEEAGSWPCSDCHDETMPANPQVRTLEDEHDTIQLNHGGGRFWCLTCHDADDRDKLTSLKGQPIDFDASYLLCGQCHFGRQRDFFFGAHGRRMGSWRDAPRKLTPCTACHDAHDPTIKPRAPRPPDVLRPGLVRPSLLQRVALPFLKRRAGRDATNDHDDGGTP